jgi:hypothetical protein
MIVSSAAMGPTNACLAVMAPIRSAQVAAIIKVLKATLVPIA